MTRSKKSKTEPREKYIVAVDPGTREMGVALISSQGNVDAAFTLYSDKNTWGLRLKDIIDRLPFVIGLVDRLKVTDFVTEIVRNGELGSIAGILLPYFPNASFTPGHRIVPSQWKSYAKRHGAHEAPLKGVETLKQMGLKLPFLWTDIDDNAADAILLGLTFLEKKSK